MARHVQDYAVRCTLATHPRGIYAVEQSNKFLKVGASPRATQAIVLASKVRALLDGRFHASFQDVKDVLIPALRHRIMLNFEGEADGMTTDSVVEAIIALVPTAVDDVPGVK
jgi:MoxR-like ATPase